MPYNGDKNEAKERHGEGTYLYENNPFFSYQGEWKNGKKHGKGIFIMKDGSSYEGDFQDGEMIGQGIFRWPNGATYQGEFHLGEPHGEGIYVGAEHETYIGQFQAGCLHGEGEAQYKNGDHYKGGFEKHLPHGEGTMTYASSSSQNKASDHSSSQENDDDDEEEECKTYEGGFKEGKYHGEGSYYSPQEGIVYQGGYKEGKRHGTGAFQYKKNNHHIVYEGEWEDDKPVQYPTNLIIRQKEGECPYEPNPKPLTSKKGQPISIQIVAVSKKPDIKAETEAEETNQEENVEKVIEWEVINTEIGRTFAVDMYQIDNVDEYVGKKATKTWNVYETPDEIKQKDCYMNIPIADSQLNQEGSTHMVDIDCTKLEPGNYCMVIRDAFQNTAIELKAIQPYSIILTISK